MIGRFPSGGASVWCFVDTETSTIVPIKIGLRSLQFFRCAKGFHPFRREIKFTIKLAPETTPIFSNFLSHGVDKLQRTAGSLYTVRLAARRWLNSISNSRGVCMGHNKVNRRNVRIITNLRFVLMEKCPPFPTQNASKIVRDAYDRWTRPDICYAKGIVSRKSTLGVVFTLNGGVVVCCSIKQGCIVDSTMETDKTVANSKEPRKHKREKHIERKYHLIQKIVQGGDVIVTKIASEPNIAYPFTKTLTDKVFETHLESLSLRDMYIM
ncbi:retrovirus-related pol polyprotein from transposon tnt 1-94 [Cucumis melo var. makuwa]|uniref:Retrovirus-related pol polyprotein from transposon tnt 1-94 n=1 Tax=Cucumis melo var. makuwa TaxID=1194695 RepID=A0A5A7U2T1_CUCMM|nr:retrovirus-related pol polyprotein from transposon tnt 1-94 [Cucumis melo var. makuwa]TYK08898.1 retrovirus-related pol polyprotein from transposon tnt 1-94 [Cucumis melo var. makuwa]